MRFAVVIRPDGRMGILDTQGKKFAHFHEGGPIAARHRADTAAARLNSGEDTTTGYAWEPA